MADYSPVMKQYLEIKSQNADSILFFRLGDFYEMFFEDAKLASNELGLALTGKDCGTGERAPMCGVPFHSCENYIARLVSKGYKVAMCEQIEEPSQSKKLVKRRVVRVITPGTITEETMLDESKNNFISTIYCENSACGLCFCDISTGELNVTQILSQDPMTDLKNEFVKYSPREVIFSGNERIFPHLKKFLKEKLDINPEFNKYCNFDKFNENSFKNLKIPENLRKNELAMRTISVLFEYLRNTLKADFSRITNVNFYSGKKFMYLDHDAIRNLELVRTLRGNEKVGTLLWLLDKTRTAPGKRLLRNYIERPLLDVREIQKRQDAVQELAENIIKRSEISKILGEISDTQRIMSRVVYGSANARDLRSLAATLSSFSKIKNALANSKCELLRNFRDNIDTFEDISELVFSAIIEEPPISIRDGGIIRTGFDKELDSIIRDLNSGKTIIADIEANERQKTGIPKLKVSYNRIFGYYIEVTNLYKEQIPDNYVRKQTLSNCERYITAELKDLETRILSAKERKLKREFEIFADLRQKVASQLERIEKSTSLIAQLDVMTSFAEIAVINNYSRPEITNSDEIILSNNRHPVVESLLNDSVFVPNDVRLDGSSNNILIITGPNMAGKSTYMRQVALTQIMAQIGSFVPASAAKICIVDSIFTRIGASDDLATGQSTFMIEMNEISNIIKNATSKSLLILDEVGRGTSTFDGMSIAQAIIEYISNNVKAKTLFATHYHELTALEGKISGVKNYSTAVKRHDDNIYFLRKIIRGGADDSYGIEVAKLAGIPDKIISRAKEILKELENNGISINKSNVVNDTVQSEKTVLSGRQVNADTIDTVGIDILKKLQNTDVQVLSPIEALNMLFKLAKLAKTVKYEV